MEEPSRVGYSLALSDEERFRYRMMASSAVENEAGEWLAAGIEERAAVADVGCGPGAPEWAQDHTCIKRSGALPGFRSAE
jgi:hypothetical protein